MKNVFRTLGIIMFTVIITLTMTACEEAEGLKGEQGEQGQPGIQGEQGESGIQGEPGQPGTPGATPWICVEQFWHIGGTPDECNEDCTGIAATGGTSTGNQLIITEPARTTYGACVDPLDLTGLIVSIQHQGTLIPINPVIYILLWNGEVINSGNTEITSESGIKTIYVIDITAGRIGEFSITVIGHDYNEWTTKTALCFEKEVQERTCSACGDYQTQEVGEPLEHSYSEWWQWWPASCLEKEVHYRSCSVCHYGQTREVGELLEHRYINNWLTKTPATCIAKEVQGRTCWVCGDHQTQEFGEPLGSIGDLNWVITPWAEIEMCERNGCTGHDIRPAFAIGDTGPAGGIIFYVADGQEGRQLGFTVQGYGTPGDEGYFASYTAYYLEAAPENISGSHIWASDIWDIIPGLSTSIWNKADEEPDRAIGRGRMNTAIIIARGIEMGYTIPAASECAALETGGKNDWFLPSKLELNAMYIAKAPPHNVVGLPASGIFWSSSQKGWSSDYFVFVQEFDGDYYSDGYPKDSDLNVRAIRAF